MTDITVDNAVDGKLGLADLRMDPAALDRRPPSLSGAATRSSPRTSGVQRTRDYRRRRGDGA